MDQLGCGSYFKFREWVQIPIFSHKQEQKMVNNFLYGHFESILLLSFFILLEKIFPMIYNMPMFVKLQKLKNHFSGGRSGWGVYLRGAGNGVKRRFFELKFFFGHFSRYFCTEIKRTAKNYEVHHFWNTLECPAGIFRQ